jgi:rRNA maturation endonuclease Nob1
VPSGPTRNVAQGNLRIYCYACGKQIDARAEICPKCGVRQPSGGVR